MTPSSAFRAALAALPLVALAALAPTAKAGPASPVTGYKTLADYNAAATTTATYGFENIAPAGGFANNPALTPVILVTSDNSYAVASGTYGGGMLSLNGTDSLVTAYVPPASPTSSTSYFWFGGPVTAFGTEFGFRTLNGTPIPTGTVSVQLYNGKTLIGPAYDATVSGPSTFIGMTSTQTFDTALFTVTSVSGEAVQTFDNLRLGTIGATATAAAAPEPGSIALLLTAGVPVVGLARRRKIAR